MKLLLPFLLALHASAAAQSPRLTVYYEERPPYQVRVGDNVEGLTASPAARAFKAAQLDVNWEAASMSRSLYVLKENQGSACVVALFKTKERLAFAKYTKAVYRDGPNVVLARRQINFDTGSTWPEALASSGLRLLVRLKYSYGKHIDDVLLRIKPETVVSPKSNAQLAELLVADRADLMFTSEEEATVLLGRLATKASHLHILRFADLPPGEERHIACTRNVPDDIIERLNSVIDSWGPTAHGQS
jgi:polar amino acid transport system substrate-binding protein